ncbi:hypothetical protein AWP60_05805 [Escherichia coli]|nr:hypothetical protein AWP60_05805 [Escherichia coli]
MGDYVFGLKAQGRYNGEPLTGTGKIGGMLALRGEGTPFPVQADFRSAIAAGGPGTVDWR